MSPTVSTNPLLTPPPLSTFLLLARSSPVHLAIPLAYNCRLLTVLASPTLPGSSLTILVTGHASCALFPGLFLTILDHLKFGRQQIVAYISQNQASFFLHMSNGFKNEQIHILGLPPRYYSSLHQCLGILSHPNSYAGYIGIAGAQLLYSITLPSMSSSPARLPCLVPHSPSHTTMSSTIRSLCTTPPLPPTD